MTEKIISKPWYKKWWVIVIFIFLFLGMIGSIFDNDNQSDSVDSDSKIKNEPKAVSTDEKIKSRCEDVPDFIVQRLEDSLNTEGITLRNIKAVKSNDFESVYFISADLQGPGLEGENDIATFATNKLDYSGLTFSADYVAKEFSDWPLGSTTKFNISMSNDGAQESKDCVNE